MYKRVIALLLLVLICTSVAPATGFAFVAETDLIAGIPYVERGIAPEQMIDIDAAAGFLMTRDGEVLWARNPDTHRSIASITKVMTAIVALERGNLDDWVVVSETAATVGESSAGFASSQSYTLRYMLEAMMMVSGNDSSVAIAEHIGGSEAGFVQMMNEQAAAIGMDQTHFANPHGLDQENHYSTASDVAKMIRYAMKIPVFREIVATPYFTMPNGETRNNTNRLLAIYEGANGVKTGMTLNAGLCLAASAARGDIELYSVVLAAPSDAERFQESADLLEFGFAHYASRVLMEGETQLGTIEVTNYIDVALAAGIAQSVSATYYDLLGPVEHHFEIVPVKAPISEGTVVGFVTFTQNGKELATEPIVAFESIDKPGFFEAIGIGFTRFFRWISGNSG